MPRKIISLRLLIAMVAVGAVTCNTAMGGAAFASDEAPPTTNSLAPASLDSTAAVTPRAYVPSLTRNWPFSTVFGIETYSLSGSLDAIAATGTTWIRRNGLIWRNVEPTEGARNWSAAADVEADMIAASNRNLKFILIIHGTPNWAAQFNNYMCSPIRSDKINAFAAFVHDAVARYSKPPYNVKYWEIWNEPDLGRPLSGSPTLVEQPYGCWGNPNDPYYGGGEYAAILRAVTPQIKAADPSAKVVLGGLLLDCNPNRPPANSDCAMGRYLEGILRNGGASYFDGISFHAYDFYNTSANVLGKYYSPKWFSASDTTGPVLIAKTRFIKDLLSQYGVTGKFLMNTEVGVLCYKCNTPLSNFGNTKAYYIPQAYSAAIAEGLTTNIWYSFEGWFFSELNEPAYTAFKVARNKLGDVTYTGEVTGGDVGASGVKGYKFSRNGKALWVIWSLDGNRNITLPSAPAAITDALGASVSSASTLELTVKPLYIEW
jgi:hypothetical protein